MNKKKVILSIVSIMVTAVFFSMWIVFNTNTESKTAKVSTVSEEPKPIEEEVVEPVLEIQNSLSPQIDDYLYENNITSDDIAIAIENYNTGEVYEFNLDNYFFAASVYKLPLAMHYYDLINSGEYTLQDGLLYQENHYEAGGPIADNYPFQSYISLEVLLNNLIVYSDNTAGHILFDNLSGWLDYKKAITKYSDTEYPDIYYSYSNVQTAAYLRDVLQHLYTNKEQYTDLISNMSIAAPNQYLNSYLLEPIPQKYGHYGPYVNSVGINLSNNPYGIVILSSLGDLGELHIGNISKICYEYFMNPVN